MLTWLKKISFDQVLLAGAVFFLSLVIFSLSYQNRIRIYNWFLYLNEGPAFYDYGRFDDEPYGFTEDADLALFSLHAALEELGTYSSELYYPDSDIPESINQQTDLSLSWELHMSEKALENTSMFLRDLTYFCKDIISYETELDKFEQRKQLKKRYRITHEDGSSNPLRYAVTDEDYHDHRLFLTDLYNTFIEKALRRKPDAKAILLLREAFDSASCKEYSSIGYWQSALDYQEYKAEARMFKVMAKTNLPLKNELIEYRKWQMLAASETYRDFIREYFFRVKKVPGNEYLLLTSSRAFYDLTREELYLLSIFETSLRAHKFTRHEDTKVVFQRINEQANQLGLSSKPSFSIILAEAAYSAGEFALIEEMIRSIENSPMGLKSVQKRRLERLKLLLEIHRDSILPESMPKAGAREVAEL